MSDDLDIVRRYRHSLPIDLEAIFSDLRIHYEERPMPKGHSGRIDYREPFCTVTVNSNEGVQRRRFTAAHELGHYILHRDLLMSGEGHLDRLFENGGNSNPFAPLSDKHEVQANQFAADLLMPESTLRLLYEPDRDNVIDLAKLCEVSYKAMEIRLRSLGIRP